MKTVYNFKYNCFGCAACMNICPTKSIKMKSDEEGFLYPSINENKCINCLKCREICPFFTINILKHSLKNNIYACKHKSKNVLKNSTSGGLFTALSDVFLRNGFYVVGADFTKKFSVYHNITNNKTYRDRMRFSKYSQSDMKNIYIKILDKLKNNKKVLFTGTPCQCAGIKNFFRNSNLYKNLYITDIICHSIPSPLILKHYILYLENKYNGKINQISFRTKNVPWSRKNSNRGFKFKIKNKIYEDNKFYDLYFKSSFIARPSCYKCPFTDIDRVSDITIADYWGIEKYDSKLYDPLGVSLAIVNSTKGYNLFNSIKNNIHFSQRNKEEVLNEQARLKEPLKEPVNRNIFWKDFRKYGFDFCIYKYT